MSQISIVIPCFNEADCLGQTLKEVANFFNQQKISYEIIVVDDGSTDQTVSIAQQFGALVLLNDGNRGKGYSVRRGFLASRGDFVLLTDADLSTPISELPKLAAVDKPIAIGSRAVSRARVTVSQNWLKRLIGRAGNFIIRLILGLSIKDTQCGFKLFDRSKSLILFERQKLNGWGFDFEILFLARQQGLSVAEVGVLWANNPTTTVTWQGYIKTLLEVLLVRWYYFTKQYN